MAILSSYSQKLTFLLTIFIFAPFVVLLAVFAESSRAAWAIALGIPALFVIVHLTASVYFVYTGGTSVDQSTFATAVQGAGFLPQNLVLDPGKRAQLDLKHATGISSGRSSSSSSGTLYIPFDRSVWPDDQTPVILESNSSPEHVLDKVRLEGTIRKTAIPYLVRRGWAENKATIGIIISDHESVRGLWGGAAVAYGIVLVLLAIIHFRSATSPPASQSNAQP